MARLGLLVLGGPALCYLWLGAPHEAASGVRPNPKPAAAARDPQGRVGEPARLVERALQLVPKNTKVLALAGSLALDRKDYAAAMRYWEQLARAEPAGSAPARQARLSIAQAQRLADAPAGFMRVVVANTSAGALRTTP